MRPRNRASRRRNERESITIGGPFPTSGHLRTRRVAFRLACNLHVTAVVEFLHLVACYMYKDKDKVSDAQRIMCVYLVQTPLNALCVRLVSYEDLRYILVIGREVIMGHYRLSIRRVIRGSTFIIKS